MSRTRWLTVLGLVAVAGDVGLPFVIAAWQPGYSHLAQYMSELGARGRPGAMVLSGWWVVSGLLLMGFAYAVHRETRGGRWGVVGPLLIAAYGLFTGVGSGLFPCDEGCRGEDWIGQVHELSNVVGAFAQLGSAGACALRWRGVERGWAFAPAAMAAQVVLLVAFALFLGVGEMQHGQPDALSGLFQRLYQGAFYLWLAVVGVGLLDGRRRRIRFAAQPDP